MGSITNEASPLLLLDAGNNATVDDSIPLLDRIRNEVDEQWELAFPTLQGLLLTKIPWFISLRFVGELGAEELAAAALATTLCNVTGFSLSVGLSSALTTLAAQAKGELTNRLPANDDTDTTATACEHKITNQGFELTDESNKEAISPLVFLYRGILIQLGLVIPIGIWWIVGIKTFLVAVGQSEHLASMTEAYLRILAPGLWCYSINWTLTAWVQAIGMADVPVYATALGLFFHIPLNWFFVDQMSFGYLGVAIATVCFYVIQVVFELVYLFALPKGCRRVIKSTGSHAIGRSRLTFWKEFRIAALSLRGVVQYLTLAVPGIVSISEWWASEVSIFLSGHLVPNPEVALGGMTIYQSINSFCFMFPMAFSVAGASLVGRKLGSGDAVGAQTSAWVSTALASIVSAACGCFLFCVPHTFLPSLFAPNEPDVILQTSRTIPLLSLYVFADGIQNAMCGIVKGCGRQCIMMPVVVIAYWVVGIPLAYYLSFVRHDGVMLCSESYFCGDVALVAGMTIGTWAHMLMLAIVVVGTTNWKKEAQLAKRRVS